MSNRSSSSESNVFFSGMVPPGLEASKRLRAPLPFPFPPLSFPSLHLFSPDNGGGVGGDMIPHDGVWGGAPAANEIPCILVEI